MAQLTISESVHMPRVHNAVLELEGPVPLTFGVHANPEHESFRADTALCVLP